MESPQHDHGDHHQHDRDPHLHALLCDDDREASLHLRKMYALGNRICGRSLVDFVAEGCVAYPVAHHIAIFHLESKVMEFLHPVRHVKSVQCFSISPNREFLAVAEIWNSTTATGTAVHISPSPTKTAAPTSVGATNAVSSISIAASLHREQEQRVISIYNVSTRARVRIIPLPAQISIASCDFSSDNKFLAVLEDAPAHNVTYWKISNAKLIASCKCPSRGTRVHINPNNPSFISVSGPSILKYWVWANREFRIGNFLPTLRDQEHFVDHVWLRQYMITVSERGLLLIFRSAADSVGVDLAHTSRCHQPSFVRLECLAVHTKGFVIGGSAGFFSVYEASEDLKDPFPFVRSVSVGEVAFDCLAVSPSSELVVACAKSRDLIHFPMSAIDMEQEDLISYAPLLPSGTQTGAVWHVDSCILRPIIATCGADRTVRVWNTETHTYEIVHACAEEPSSLALHPSGFQVVVAFKERTRVYHVLNASLRQARELALKACRFVRYAHGGHIFACAAGLTVRIYRSYTTEALHTLSGHIGAVRYLSFSMDDSYIFSAGHDGTLYRWNASSGLRSDDMQHVVKQCQYATLVVDNVDATIVVVAGSDGKLREIIAGEEAHVVDLPVGTNVTALTLSRDNRRLFAGTSVGSIQIYAWPLRGRHLVECFVQTEAITHLRITDSGECSLLVSSAEDGSVCFFRLLDSSGSTNTSMGNGEDTESINSEGRMSNSKAIADKKRFSTSASTSSFSAVGLVCDAVLVARDDLEDRDANILEMQQQYAQVKADVEFALHRKENEWVDRLHVVKDDSERLVVQERARFEDLEARHQLMLRRHAEELSQLEANHVKMTQELENQYERKLAQEVARYDSLSETLELTRQRCEALVESQDQQHRGALHAERKAAYSRSKEQNDVIKRLHDDLNYNHAKFEEVLRQEEVDYELEIQRLRVDYEKQLENERQTTAVKQGQVSAANTKIEAMKKKMQELKASSLARDVLLATERAKVAKLEDTIATFEEHFQESKVVMGDKEKTIAGLQSSNRILESFRSVLSHRIDNLEKEKAPMVDHVHGLESHISDMQSEMAEEYKQKGEQQQDAESKDAKIRLLLNEIKMLRQSTLKKDYSMSEMTREFARLVQISNLKDLASAVKDSYRAFVIGEAMHKKPPKPILSSSLSISDLETLGEKSVDKKTSPALKDNKVSSSPSRHKRGESDRETTAPSPNGRKRHNNSLQPNSELSAAATDEALGYDTKQAVNESVKQMEYMSRTIMTLRSALDNANAKADRIRRDSVAEGSQLIQECNKLRKENKSLLIKIRDLERSLNGFGTSSPVSSRPMTSSHSSPQFGAHATLSVIDQEPLIIDVGATYNSSVALQPLSITTPSRKSGFGSSHLASPSPTRKASNHALPFARIEKEREMRSSRFAKVEELSAVVDRQKREIQRLQTQVQLLLSEDPADPAAHPSARALEPLPVSARAGVLRPLSSSSQSRALHPSFVLTPAVAPDGGLGDAMSNQDLQER